MTEFGIGSRAARWRSGIFCTGAGVFFVGALLTLGGIYLQTMLSKFGHLWAVSDRLRSADAAAVLGGGLDDRPAAAAQLYKAGEVKQILVSKATYHQPGPSYPDSEALIKLGIPPSAIVEFGDDPSSTYEEARALASWAKQNDVRRVIVPTETFPSRRVRWILRHELGKVGVDARVETLTPKVYNLDNWWDTEAGRSELATEIIKYLYYRVRYWRS